MAEWKPSPRSTVLQLLKQSKGMTAQELAKALAISPVAVRKHLETFHQEGLVEVGLRRRPVGRPSYIYVLTAKAAALFPQDYRQMLIDMLQDLAAREGEHQLKRLFEARAERQRHSYEQQLIELSRDERVKELARLRDADGYMAALEEDEASFILRQYNCPVQEVSRRFRQACGCEIDLLRDLLGIKRIERIETLANGDPSCAYRIPKSPAGGE